MIVGLFGVGNWTRRQSQGQAVLDQVCELVEGCRGRHAASHRRERAELERFLADELAQASGLR